MAKCERCGMEIDDRMSAKGICAPCGYWKAAAWKDKTAGSAQNRLVMGGVGGGGTGRAVGSKRAAGGGSGPLERDIQKAVHKFLAHDPRVAWVGRFNSGAATAGSGADTRYIRMNTVAGCSDLLGQLKSGHLLAVEVKRPGGGATELQTQFLGRVRDNGGCAGIARSVDDVKRLIDEFWRDYARVAGNGL